MLFDCKIGTMLEVVESTPEEQARYIMDAFSYADQIDRHALVAAARGVAETTLRRRGKQDVIEFNPAEKQGFAAKRKGLDDMDRKTIEKKVEEGKRIAEELADWARLKEENLGGETPDTREVGGDAVALMGIFGDISDEIAKEG